MKKRSMFIIIFSVFTLILTVGYSLFSDKLTVKGTATAFGTFDMQFKDATITNQVGSSNASAIISNDNKSLSINIPKLEYPGAYVLISVTVISNGSVPSKLIDVVPEGLTTDQTVKVSYENLEELKNITLNNGDKQSFKIKVVWDKTSNQSSKDVSFSIKLNYRQAV